MALYRTDPYHTILYMMHVYRTVRYRTVLKSKPIRHLREDHGEKAIYRTVRYIAVRHRGGMWGRVVPYMTNCAGKCGGSRSQAHAMFRSQIILQVGDRILPNLG